MNFKEFINKNEKTTGEALKCKDISEFKKLADENKIEYTEEELKQAWNRVQSKNTGKDGELNEDALDSVAGGKGDKYSVGGSYNKNA